MKKFEKRMEKCTTIILATLVVILTFLMVTRKNIYEREGIIFDITDDDIVTVLDTTGNKWEYKSNAFSLGQTVILKMNDNNTEEIFDDIIEKITVIGI